MYLPRRLDYLKYHLHRMLYLFIYLLNIVRSFMMKLNLWRIEYFVTFTVRTVSFTRFLQNTYIILFQASRAPKASETPHVPRSLKWSKRDKMEFFRQLMRWGLPLVLLLYQLKFSICIRLPWPCLLYRSEMLAFGRLLNLANAEELESWSWIILRKFSAFNATAASA